MNSLFTNAPRSGGWLEQVIGKVEMDTMKTQLPLFADAMVAYEQKLKDVEFDGSYIERSENAARLMNSLFTDAPRSGGSSIIKLSADWVVIDGSLVADALLTFDVACSNLTAGNIWAKNEFRLGPDDGRKTVLSIDNSENSVVSVDRVKGQQVEIGGNVCLSHDELNNVKLAVSSATATSAKVSNLDIWLAEKNDYLSFVNHSHKVTPNADGSYTLSTVSETGGTFKRAGDGGGASAVKVSSYEVTAIEENNMKTKILTIKLSNGKLETYDVTSQVPRWYAL